MDFLMCGVYARAPVEVPPRDMTSEVKHTYKKKTETAFFHNVSANDKKKMTAKPASKF